MAEHRPLASCWAAGSPSLSTNRRNSRTNRSTLITINGDPFTSIPSAQLPPDKTFACSSTMRGHATPYLCMPLKNSSTYGNLLLRISRNVVPTWVVSRLRSNQSKIARICSSLPNEKPCRFSKYLATTFSSLGGISSNDRGPLLRNLIGGLPLTLTTEKSRPPFSVSSTETTRPCRMACASALFIVLFSSWPIRRMPQPRR